MSFTWPKGIFIRTRLLRCFRLLGFGLSGLTLGLVVLLDPDSDNEKLRNHEAVHVRQYLELLFVGFILLYVFFWLLGMFRGLSSGESYLANPFELEARDFSERFEERKWFGWLGYIF